MTDDRTKPPPWLEKLALGHGKALLSAMIEPWCNLSAFGRNVIWAIHDEIAPEHTDDALRREGYMMALDALKERHKALDGPDAGERWLLRIIIERLEDGVPGEPTP